MVAVYKAVRNYPRELEMKAQSLAFSESPAAITEVPAAAQGYGYQGVPQ